MSAVPEEKRDISDMVEVPPPAPVPSVRAPMDSAVELLKAGLTTDQLREMMGMQLQWEANEARKAYIVAMTEFKKAPPEIVKRTLVDFPSKGGRTTYMHATLGDVCNAVIESLAKHGFSHRWASRNAKDEGLYVTCILTHRLGHSESFEMGPGKPDDSGGKNPIQAIASTQTYFQRYSLLGICGLTSNDMRDDDGKGGPDGGFRLEEWLNKAGGAPDLAELSAVKDQGFAIFKKRNDPEGFNHFKAAISARRADLDPEYAKQQAAKKPPEEKPEPGSEG